MWWRPALMNKGCIPHSSIIARVIDAGVGQPVGVSGLTGWLVMAPHVISSASSTGVRRVFSGVAPAPETPGTVERSVLPRMPQKMGLVKVISGVSDRNPMVINAYIFSSYKFEDIGYLKKFHNDIIVLSPEHLCTCLKLNSDYSIKA
jgi:hypothetical protein